MGIVNVTPDSFSDGGKFNSPEEAIRCARNLVAEGAEIIDIGGESTRPGAVPITWEEEWSRIEPVLRGLSPSVSERLKELTRGRRVNAEIMKEFVQNLDLPAADKKRLLKLTPATYIGIAPKLARLA
jgi:dihydropteroate synthase